MKTLKGLLIFLLPVLAVFAIPEFTNADQFTDLMLNFSGVATLTILVTEAMNKALNLHEWKAVASSIFTAVGLTFLSWWLNLGFIEITAWPEVLVTGIFASFVANRWFEYDMAKRLLDLIFRSQTPTLIKK